MDNGKNDGQQFIITAGYWQVCIQELSVSGTTNLRYVDLFIGQG